MKIRVKLIGPARIVDCGDAGSEITIAQLSACVADVFQLHDRQFSLSLNKQDAFPSDETTLEQLGIVPGDLLYIMHNANIDVGFSNKISTNFNNNTSKSGTLESPSTSSSDTGNNGFAAAGNSTYGIQPCEHSSDLDQIMMVHETVTAADDVGVNHAETIPSENQSSPVSYLPSTSLNVQLDNEMDDSTIPSPLLDPEVNRCLQEPLMVRESTDAALPAVLQSLFQEAKCCTPSDALWVVIQVLMRETGFRPAQHGEFTMGENWNKHGFYQCTYIHVYGDARYKCTVVGVPMGKLLILHGLTEEDPPFETQHLQLNVTDYIRVRAVTEEVHGVYSNLERLSRTVKDLVCQPLCSHLEQLCGYPVALGLVSLSYELKLKVLSFLPASSLVRIGQTCHSFEATYKDPSLWRRLYLRYFGRHSDSNSDSVLSKDWYKLYKDEYIARRERRKASYLRHQMTTGVFPWTNTRPGYYPPLIPPPYMGGIIGGEYDLNPEFASGIRHPLFRGPPGSSFLPHPRFDDPFGPGCGPGQSFNGGSRNSRYPFAGIPFGRFM